jgi:hypothetical protein
MGLKHLRDQNPNMECNLVNIISKFDTTKTKKVTPLLLKILKSKTENYEDDYFFNTQRNPFVTSVVNGMTPIEKQIGIYLIDRFFYIENIEKLPLFVDYLERGLIDNNDVSKYNTMDDILNEISVASTKESLKNSKKDIMIVHDDGEWLCFKPMTYESSVTYGYGAKWCTSMKFEPEYFYRHSAEGILIYVINQKTGRKFGFYRSKHSNMSIWDEKGDQIDSLDTDISRDLLLKLKDLTDVKNHQFNIEHFSVEEKLKANKYVFYDQGTQGLTIETIIPAEGMEEPMPIIDRPLLAPVRRLHNIYAERLQNIATRYPSDEMPYSDSDDLPI